MTIETIIRPFIGESVTPRAFIKPGGVASAPVRIGPIGLPGGTTTFTFNGSGTNTTYMAAVHKEKNVPSFDYSAGKIIQ
jgi:hypothetical protein